MKAPNRRIKSRERSIASLVKKSGFWSCFVFHDEAISRQVVIGGSFALGMNVPHEVEATKASYHDGGKQSATCLLFDDKGALQVEVDEGILKGTTCRIADMAYNPTLLKTICGIVGGELKFESVPLYSSYRAIRVTGANGIGVLLPMRD